MSDERRRLLARARRKLKAGLLLTPEEQDRLDECLELRENWNGEGGPRSIGTDSNRKRSKRHKALWILEARRLIAERPLSTLPYLAGEVLKWCNSQTPPIAMDKKGYSQETIYKHLRKERAQLAPTCSRHGDSAASLEHKAFTSAVQDVIQSER
jgi:hypothetical protein